MKFSEIMKLWSLVVSIKAINQIKVAGTFVFDKYFKGKGKPVLGNTAKLKIKKGASIVLRAIAPGADRLVKDTNGTYELTISLPRFGLSGQILAHEMNEFESLEGEAKVEAVSQKIIEILTEHKEDYMTTIEYMSTGALFGKVIDGDGVVLFEFNTTAAPIEFKSKENIDVLDEIDEALADELGTEVPYEILADAKFINRVAANAKTAELFKTGEAKWLDEDGKRVLVVHSKRYIPFRASYTDENGDKQPFIPEAQAVVIPLSQDVFKHIYGRADHVEAMKAAPKLFFAAKPEILEKGKGWGIETETKMIPYCVRPGALIKLKFSE
ncbi:major capsid protein [Sulfurimonas sp.]|uniref:major capsid protein n=1 Tax=Sulfurimonas sp. TaxID=2022749 RepID=UPI0025DDD76C|nr:major capsid protein [Sulfurimonas sp.]